MRIGRSIGSAIATHSTDVEAHHIPPKVKLETRAMGAASGDVSYTGYGFQPTGLIIFALTGVWAACIGISDPTGSNGCLAVGIGEQANVMDNLLIELYTEAGKKQEAILKSYDADGFTLTWTLTGTPSGTANLYVIATK